MQNDKITAYLGFAKRSGNLRAGVNAVSALRRADLLVLCATAAPGTVREAEKLSAKWACPLLVSRVPVEEITGKENCKLIAVTEPNLARAILAETQRKNEHFTVKSGGCK